MVELSYYHKKELINNKAKKGYLTRSATTRSLQKELGNLINNRDIRRIKNDNSEGKILSIINGFKKIEDYTSYKTQRTRYHDKQSSKEEPRHG